LFPLLSKDTIKLNTYNKNSIKIFRSLQIEISRLVLPSYKDMSIEYYWKGIYSNVSHISKWNLLYLPCCQRSNRKCIVSTMVFFEYIIYKAGHLAYLSKYRIYHINWITWTGFLFPYTNHTKKRLRNTYCEYVLPWKW
jgi:hypothetical protein